MASLFDKARLTILRILEDPNARPLKNFETCSSVLLIERLVSVNRFINPRWLLHLKDTVLLLSSYICIRFHQKSLFV